MKYVLTLLGGLILGVVLTLFFLGAPRGKPMPGVPVKAPDPNAPDAGGTALVTLDEKFFDALLGSIFRDMGGPSFRLSSLEGGATPDKLQYLPAAFQGGCPDVVTLAPEGSGTKTGVRFTQGKVVAPLAFSGSYSVLGACLNFKGAAQASVNLYFDQGKQTVYGQVNVETVNLEGVPAGAGGIVTLFVQRSINERVNPLEVLRAPQLALNVPVEATGGTLKAQVKDVRAEVLDGSLRMHITYDFTGIKGQAPPPPPPQG
ncbi:MAG: hypothetical protein QOF02_1705 [Blastocatellia bacterium]|jgi:hypothetical protein|nr:hypothetical protein [Blastocatellia bacterium]